MEKWYESAVFYHMYPLGMLGAPKRNDQNEVVHRLKDLLPWVDHIKKIGCTAIYIGPLFESTSHGYDTKDYKMVDRRLGDNEDFKEFVSYCHQLDVKVVVDGVFNHTGREFLHFRISRRTGKALPIVDGIRKSAFRETPATMMDFGIRHGEIALSWPI